MFCVVAAGSNIHSHTRREEISLIHLPETWCSASSKPFPANDTLPSFSSENTAASLHHPQPQSKQQRVEWVDGGHAYRCSASGQQTNYDDNLNDDDDK